ncbi:hypothetical protein M3O96_04640 [Aquiflexum sp. TKW24L]|nr:hypothetical protein [Aquiflexum sp. TKW24L]MCL6258362.1 hypothetical protein [Aquiflexum sp. TKW24L]
MYKTDFRHVQHHVAQLSFILRQKSTPHLIGSHMSNDPLRARNIPLLD